MNETRKTKKISYKSLTEKMSDEKLKNIVAGCSGDFLCWRYCYTMGWPEKTASTWYPSCYDHYHHCTQNGWVSDCACV